MGRREGKEKPAMIVHGSGCWEFSLLVAVLAAPLGADLAEWQNEFERKFTKKLFWHFR